jgi:hypothetical protein
MAQYQSDCFQENIVGSPI